MDISGKKILHLTTEKESFDQIKSVGKKSEYREYKKHWKEQFLYPCGTFKKYDFVLLQDRNQADDPQLLVEFRGINIVREKKSWLKTNKYFEIELGKIVEETNEDKI